MGIVVRAETERDAVAVQLVNQAAFGGDQEVRLIRRLRDTDSVAPGLSLVAEENGRVVGHLVLSKARLEREGGDALEILALGPMSVVPSHSHRGIGSRLVRAAIEEARRQGYPAIVVTGYPDYYRRFGFEPAAGRGLSCNLDAPESAVLVLELREGVLAGGGRIVYPSPYEEVF